MVNLKVSVEYLTSGFTGCRPVAKLPLHCGVLQQSFQTLV